MFLDFNVQHFALSNRVRIIYFNYPFLKRSKHLKKWRGQQLIPEKAFQVRFFLGVVSSVAKEH